MMLRDFKFLKRKQKEEEVEAEEKEIENVHVNFEPADTASSWSSASQSSVDRFTAARPPLNAILPDLVNNPRSEGGGRSKFERTPTKPKSRPSDHSGFPLRTPDRFGGGFPKQRLGWGQRNSEEPSGFPSVTPRSTTATVRATGKANSDCSSTQSTPTKSVSKPSVWRTAGCGGGRPSNGGSLYRGLPISGGCTGGGGFNSAEVPHFDLKEDPSFWMDHNVQVLIRVRPLSSTERSMNGYSRCLRQDSPQTITWIGQPETRFTFDHVACETVDQEVLFRMAGLPMVENCLSGYNSCIFAYGQTGSGKTYTMLGEIDNIEFKPSPNRGMTPRIFEFLFARIQAEEESRRDERLKYNCKCSFLEIYNEQITDLLDPSSSNLLLREDAKKGVYVENLSEFEVHDVSDILKLLTQGSLNRKVASTNMNRESSRSHCVFTCVIESKWEKDSATNLRFARLNLVDLAGSERQKSSGAEGERLKEAANINKSLSTLGHVIMILVDVAHGKQRHVPYRDSRLTFLLQDSLGGNSKTMIIANVSPSICCAAETLNTLKFAQRAKLIQNNAVVNEDSTGDIAALQHQIRLLKDEISLLKHQNVVRPLSFCSNAEPAMHEEDDHGVDGDKVNATLGFESRGIVTLSTKQFKSVETTLAGALRREQMAETTIKKLEAEIEHLNRLVRQREEDTRSIKMMLRFREDKIQRMESLLGGSLTSDAFLLEENRSLSEEIQLLQAKVDKNPEVTRFALENIRLLDQLRRFQEFYEEGEREILSDEVTNLRGQLLQFLDENSQQHDIPHRTGETQECKYNSKPISRLNDDLKELEECRSKLSSCLEENKTLRRELHDLHAKLENLENGTCRKDGNANEAKDPLRAQYSDGGEDNRKGISATTVVNHGEDILDLQLEIDILKIILKEERSSRAVVEQRAFCLNIDLELAEAKLLSLRKEFKDAIDELKETKSVVAALESQQILAIEEMEDLRRNNNNYEALLAGKEHQIMSLKNQVPLMELRDHPASNKQNERSRLLHKLKRMQDSLEKAKRLNTSHKDDHPFQTSNEEEMDEIRRQAEAETAEVIVCMEEELCILQQQVHDCNLKEIQTKQAMLSLETEVQVLQEKISGLSEDNEILHRKLEEQNLELRIYSEEWELLSCEMEEVLSDGQDAIAEASEQLDLITSSLPQRRIWISENVGRLSRLLAEKDMLIEELGQCLEEANTKRVDLEFKLQSLRAAALVISEAHQKEYNESEREALTLKSHLTEKISRILELEEKAKVAEFQAFRASRCATAAFIIVNHLSQLNSQNACELKTKDIQIRELAAVNLRKEPIPVDGVASERETEELFQCPRSVTPRKESLPVDRVASERETEEVFQCFRSEIIELRDACGTLQERISEKERHACSLEQVLEDLEHNDLMEMREKLAELSAGILSLKSCMGIDVNSGRSHKNEEEDAFSSDDLSNIWTGAGKDLRSDISDSCSKAASGTFGPSDNQGSLEFRHGSTDASNIVLMKKEIELALESFQELQMEVIKQLGERKELLMFKEQYKERMKSFVTQLFTLQAAFSNFGQQFDSRFKTVDHKLLTFEQTFHEALTLWGQTKEFLELETGDAKLYSAQKAAEASCIYAKFEEAQETLKDADIMLNELMIANEKTKLDKDRMKQMENRLTAERDKLMGQVQNLQSMNDLKDQRICDLEEQYCTDMMEMKNLVNELEFLSLQVQKSYEESFSAMVHDFQGIESVVSDCGKLVKSWIEDVWSEIIVKDCAISVLHLCHVGILLETVTGLNTENSLLHHGMCESDSLIADLRKNNSRTSRELQMFRSLKGKLLADLKSGFDRISRKEEEAVQLCSRLTGFEKKILDLQLQEELMLQRANQMGSQLAVLMEELDLSNRNFIESLSDQDKMLQDKEELFNSQVELFIRNLLSKDVELQLTESAMEEMGLQKVATEKEMSKCCSLLENLKRELIVSKVDKELEVRESSSKEAEISFLHKQVEEAQREREDMLSMLNDYSLRNAEMDERNNALAIEIKSLNEIMQLNNALRGELAECMEMKVRMMDQIHTLEFERDKLQKELNCNLTSLEEVECKQTVMLRESVRNEALLENLKRDLILLLIDTSSQDQLLMMEETKVEILERRIEKVQQESRDLSSRLGQSNLRNTEAEEAKQSLEREIMLLNNIYQAREDLKCELKVVTEAKERLLSRVQELEIECEKLLNDLKTKETALEVTSTQLLDMDQQKQQFEANISMLESMLNKLQKELDIKDLEICRMSCVEEENMSLRSEVGKLKNENVLILQDLKKKQSDMESALEDKNDIYNEDFKLQERILFLETMLISLQGHLETKKAEVKEMLHSQYEVSTDLCSNRKAREELFGRVKILEDEKASLQDKVGFFKKEVHEVLTWSDNNTVRCTGALESACSVCHRLLGLFKEEGFTVIDQLLHEISGNGEKISHFMQEIERLECDVKELVYHNMQIDAELVRKDDILKGLLFDLSLLQESASNTKDQKDKVEEMIASFDALEKELQLKSGELDESVAYSRMLEAQLREKIDMISVLESNYMREQDSNRKCSSEVLELRFQLQDASAANYSLEEDLTEKRSLIEKLEMGLSQMCNDIGKMSQTIDSMRCELSELANERERLNTEISYMKEELEKAHALAEENEAIALEAQQIAESRKMHAEEKEAEVKLLERSVQELESTINVLESKVDILKGEAERQRLQREEMEVELLAVNHQMQNVKSSDADTQRFLDEEGGLEQALKRIKGLERDIAERDKEISKCKAHISELNLHAEAQAIEYKQKFKELEAMAEQVRTEGHISHAANSSSNKCEKNAVKSRGSGSPFKCIGLGLAQQMKSEKDEELIAAKLHIEELESQAVCRQKEIFALNARLAAAESMTHDVIRDLLGVKLDMTNYVSLLDNQQVQKIAEKAQFSCLEPQEKEQEVFKLKQQLKEFIEERREWLEEIDRKQAEMIAGQTALEKLRQRDQLLKTEIEVLKMENGNYKQRVMDLEGEVKKLSGQQNLQQRIHHHAKIKEENNMLKLQNEELGAKLRRAEGIMIRVKEELARYRASDGKCPYINIDEEQRLMNKLKETEEDRVQLAQKLLVMCTSILKVAGITKPVTEISPATAEEALEQLKNRITSLEREIQDLIHKNRISNERIRLLELRPQAASVNSRTEENYSTPRRNQASFLSDFDR